jgi:hypothetical protein
VIPNPVRIKGAGCDGTDEVHAEPENRAATARWYLSLLPMKRGTGVLVDVGAGDGTLLQEAARRYRRALPVITSYETHYNPTRPDAITMIHVLDHFEEPLRMLGKAYTELAPRGHLLVVVHNWNCLSHRLLGNRWPPLNPYHTFFFTWQMLRDALEAVGFVVMKQGKAWNKYSVGYVLGMALGRSFSWRGPSFWWPLGNLYALGRKGGA